MAYDLQIGTATVFMEASGEPPEGQQGVCHVLLNRLKDGRWGTTLAAVCLAPYQFSSWNTPDSNRKRLALLNESSPALVTIAALLQGAIAGEVDPTGGALWYFNPALARPTWAASYVETARLGHHVFYKEPNAGQQDA